MCGISGFIDFNNNSSEATLKSITDTLTHRGPDASGYKIFQENSYCIGLGHRRLSIIDLTESAAQPMQFNNLWITFNGEIYNFKEIKNELILLDHSFVSNSDTEVILHAYNQWGVTCANKFIGMFAFVIYDSESKEIICFRDRAGVKPFYYYWHKGLFLFASELKAFHKHPDFKKEINLSAVASFMQYGNVPGSNCIFTNAYKLKSGHYLKFNLTNKTFEVFKYWSVYDSYNKPKSNISFSEAKIETEKLLKSAFDFRMVSDVPVGVFLSGGYDSSCVTALLQKDRAEKLKTFTIAVPDIGLNEAPYAKEISDHLGTEHFEFECSEKEALTIIEDLPFFYDEPFADSSAIPTTLVCKMASQSVKVVLSADGGDEIFAGYNRYEYLMKYGNKLTNTPKFVRDGLANLMNSVPADKIPFLKNAFNFHNRYEKIKSVLKDPSPKTLVLELNKQFKDDELEALLKISTKSLQATFIAEDLSTKFYSPLGCMMAIDYDTYLVDDILQKVDRASMSVGIESREPFLDHRIIEFVAQLPDDYKYDNGNKKRIIKEIVHQYLPKKMMDRPKMGFAIPIEKWLINELKTKVDHYLNEKEIEAQGIFNVNYVRQLCKSFYEGKKEYGVKIWHLLMFQMWYKKWMN
jgi:asparagine synthase (glutamine-hydrolysing)